MHLSIPCSTCLSFQAFRALSLSPGLLANSTMRTNSKQGMGWHGGFELRYVILGPSQGPSPSLGGVESEALPKETSLLGPSDRKVNRQESAHTRPTQCVYGV